MQSFLAFLAKNAKNAFELFIVDQYKTQPTTREMLITIRNRRYY